MKESIAIRYEIWKAKRLAKPYCQHMQALSDPVYVDYLAQKLFGTAYVNKPDLFQRVEIG